MTLKIERDFPYVIRLFRDAECRNGFVGSGLLIGRRHVLTCAHVADKHHDREKWHAMDCDGSKAVVVGFDFLGEEDRHNTAVGHVDLALLELESEFGETDQSGSDATATILHGLTNLRRDINQNELRAVGGIDLDSTETGQIQSVLSKRDGSPVDVQVAGGIGDGFSGGPVIMPYGRKWVCVGIAWMGRKEAATSRILTGDTIHRFLQEKMRPDLLKATGIQFLDLHAELHAESITETQRVLTKAAIDLLATSKKALDAIAGQLPVGEMQDEKKWAEAVVARLIEMESTPLMLLKLVRAMNELDKQNAKDSADLIEKLAYYLIPASLNHTHVRQLTLIINTGIESFEFQAKTKTFVEIAMARINRRPIGLRGIQNASDMPSGRLCLVDPPEQGMDENHEGFIQAFVDGLSKIVPPEFLSTSRNTSVARTENIAAINVELETLYEVKGWQRYYVFKYPENDLERNQRNAVAKKLDQLFPRIAFIGLDREHSPTDEQETLSRMRLILCRAANIENSLYGQN